MSVELIPHDDPYADIVFADARPKHVNVTIDGKPYRLRECTEAVYLDYEAEKGKNARIDDGVVTGFGSAVQAESKLLAGCLFSVNGGPDSTLEAPVTEAFVRKLPARVASPLVVRLKLISGISDLETADQLRKRIAADTKKLEKLTSGNGGDTGPKGSDSGSADISDSALNGGADWVISSLGEKKIEP